MLFLLQHSVGMLVAYWDSIEQEALQPDSRILLPTSKNLDFKFVQCFMVIPPAQDFILPFIFLVLSSDIRV